LIMLCFTVLSTCFGHTGLEEAATAAAAEVVGLVRGHVDEILFTYHRLDHETQILGHRISKTFSHQLAGILYREFNFAILVPVGADLELALPDPLGVILNDTLDFEVEVNFEPFQSGPDCEKFVPSFGVEPDLAA